MSFNNKRVVGLLNCKNKQNKMSKGEHLYEAFMYFLHLLLWSHKITSMLWKMTRAKEYVCVFYLLIKFEFENLYMYVRKFEFHTFSKPC